MTSKLFIKLYPSFNEKKSLKAATKRRVLLPQQRFVTNWKTRWSRTP